MALLIGLGAGLAVLGRYIVTFDKSPANFAFGYAPLTQSSASVFANGGLTGWEQLLVWIGLIAVWTVAALLALNPGRAGDRPRSDPPS